MRGARRQTGIGFSRPRNQLSKIKRAVQSGGAGFAGRGIEPHARIALWVPIRIYISNCFSACKKRAAFWSGSIRALPGPEVAYVLNDAQAEMVFVGKDFVPLIEGILADCPSVKRVIAMDGGHDEWTAFDAWRDAA